MAWRRATVDCTEFKLRGGLFGQSGCWQVGHHVSLPHDEHAVTEAEHLGKFRGHHQDRDALADEFIQKAIDLLLRPDVDPAGGLIDEEQVTSGTHVAREDTLLLVAATELTHALLDR